MKKSMLVDQVFLVHQSDQHQTCSFLSSKSKPFSADLSKPFNQSTYWRSVWLN